MTDFRFLRGNKSTGQPSNFVFVDTETLGQPDEEHEWSKHHSLRLGVAVSCRIEGDTVSRREVHRFTEAADFWSMIRGRLRKRTPLWIVAHNVGFDMTILGFWQLLADGVYKIGSEDTGREDKYGNPIMRNLGFACLDDPPTILTASHHQQLGKITIVDSMNYWKCSLEEIGESLDVKKTKMPKVSESDAVWFDYCEQDVVVLETAFTGLLSWVKTEDLGTFKFTAPGQAFASFRHRFMRHKIAMHDNKPIKKLERDAYFGGRLELFHRGPVKGKVYGLDVKSMYPFVMLRHAYPVKLLASSESNGPWTADPNALDRTNAADVLIESESDTYPIRCRQGMVFASGTFWTSLCGLELERAALAGHVAEVRRWASYTLKPLFTEFVNHFFGRRAEYVASGETLAADLCKLMLNSLYGKFGQLTSEWEDVAIQDGPGSFEKWSVMNVQKSEVTEYRKLGKLVQKRVTRTEHKNAFPAIAAWVTAAAREYLLELIQCANVENVLYVVTDALYVTGSGRTKLQTAGYIDGSKLGTLAVECEGRNARFEALHHFQVGTKKKFGSRKAKAIEFPDGDIEELKFEGLASITSREPTPTVRVYKQVKSFTKAYRRGVTDEVGSVKPFHLDETEIIRSAGKLPDLSCYVQDRFHLECQEATQPPE